MKAKVIDFVKYGEEKEKFDPRICKQGELSPHELSVPGDYLVSEIIGTPIFRGYRDSLIVISFILVNVHFASSALALMPNG